VGNELQTLFASMALDMALASIALAIGVGFRPSGLRTWTVALVLQTIGWGMLAIHDPQTDWLSESIGMLAIVASVSWMGKTAEHYLGLEKSAVWAYAPIVLTLALRAWIRLDLNQFIVLAQLVVGAQLFWIVWMLTPKSSAQCASRWRWLALSVYTVGALTVVATILWFLWTSAHATSPVDEAWNLAVGIIGQAWAVIATFATMAFLLAHRDEAEQALQRYATVDDLTGLLNRRAAMELMADRLASRARSPRPLTMMILDLDHFKSINDTHGHPAGDEVIRRFARILSSNARPTDLVGRYGGEEFCVLLECEAEFAETFDRRLRAALAETSVVHESRIRFDFSSGAASTDEGNETLAHLISRADRALYAAKAAGRGQLHADLRSSATGGGSLMPNARVSVGSFDTLTATA